MATFRTAGERMPRYLQVASILRRRVRDGVWRVGKPIATVAMLQQEFGVARVTVRQAIQLLAGEGILRPEQGRGTFVAKQTPVERWLRLATDWEGLLAPIRDNRLQVLETKSRANPRIAADEGTPAASYVYIHSLQRRGRAPFGIASIHVAEPVHRKAARRFKARVGLDLLLELARDDVAQARLTFAVAAADIETARLLGLAMNAPTVEARCVVRDHAGLVLYVGEFIYRGDVVRFEVDLAGPGGRAKRGSAKA